MLMSLIMSMGMALKLNAENVAKVVKMIDDYSDISQDDLDRLEARRDKMEKEKVSERQTLKTGIACSDMIDDALYHAELYMKTDCHELDGFTRKKAMYGDFAQRSATLAVKLQQIHMMRSGLLPPMSANKETQQAWEQKAINQYEAEREKRKQARMS